MANARGRIRRFEDGDATDHTTRGKNRLLNRINKGVINIIGDYR